jgi:DNA (cytosine-5)-methyltransferase 1
VKHASFFSGVGGLDLGFERAGIKTVSVCEIDPYANSVLAERFSGVPNLGSITEINADDIPEADIWSGGFPCQDLSLAGKRAGFFGGRSSLAFTFLNAVERRRPRWLVLENVPGLLTSNDGRDFLRLLREMDDIGYYVSWRSLNAKHFGVPQRRSRVFVVAHLEPGRAEQVLFECEGRCGHLAPSRKARQETSEGYARGTSGDQWITKISINIGSAANADRVREADGLARWMDDSIISFPSRYSRHPTKFNNQTDPLTISAGAPAVVIPSQGFGGDDIDPIGLDSNRYKCIGNGVVSNVAEWIGIRIAEVDTRWNKEDK